MDQKEPRRRPKVKRFTAPRREAFLAFLRKTGNFSAAAQAVGIDRSTAEQRRKRDAQFALDCMAAKAAAARLLAGATDCFDGVADAELQTIKRGPHGRAMIVAARKGKWCKSTEEVVLAVLRQCGNAAAAARAAGISEGTIWTRRRQWPAFRARMEEALEEAEVVLEFRLATMGGRAWMAEDGAGEAEGMGAGEGMGTEGTGTVTSNCPPAIPFDADLALRFLKWRELKRQGHGWRRGRHNGLPDRPFEEVVDSIMGKIEAIERHENQQRLAEGWSQDEEGRMIPPGWVRKEGGDGEADEERDGDDDGNGDRY